MILFLLSISTETLVIDSPDTSEIDLGYSFIIVNSDSLWCGEELLLRDSSYIIDYQNGSLKLLKNCSMPFKFKFSHVDFSLNETYSKWRAGINKVLSTEMIENIKERDDDKLIINGNKGLFVDIRSRGTDISQSLWMEIGGKAGQFDVSGVLSDENIPQGGDVSQSLREIDEIFIEAISDNMSFRVGDILTEEEGLDKKLLGVSSSWQNLYGVVGVAKAKYGKNTFKTSENKQGPYKINPEEEVIGISIVRGSEQVWLNGRLLEEGTDNDYVINYSENSVTFNPSVFLDNESVVLVLFQYSVYGESNVFYKAAFESDDYFFSFLRKEDFSEKDLVEFYPDSGFGYRYAAVNVGEGKGDYVLQDSIFVYQGYQNGSYEVYFEWVGEGNGEYEYIDSLHYFLWTGDGPYSAKRKVPLGEEDNLFSCGLNKELENFSLSGQLKARRIRIPSGGDKKDGLNTNIKSIYNPYDFLSFSVNFSKRTTDFVVKEWEGDKDILKTWEMNSLPSDFLECGVKLIPNSKIECSYYYGKADTLRKDKINLGFQPLYFDWENIRGYRQDLKGGLRIKEYDFFYRNLRREENYRKEFSAGSPFLSLLYGLEGGILGDTAKLYMARTNVKYKIATLSASHLYKRNLNSGQLEKITNGTLDMNLILNSFYFRSKFNVSRKKASIWQRYYQDVNPGEGNYSYDSTNNTYYSNPYGNYIQRTVYTGEEQDSREYSTDISVRLDRLILINGYLNAIYIPELMNNSDGLLSVKFPKESKNRAFFKVNFSYNRGEDFLGLPDRNYGKIDCGWENITRGYKSIGLTREWSIEETRYGGYFNFWNQSGFELKLEGLFTVGEDTLLSSILVLGYRLSGNRRGGLIQVTLGYNYYTGGDVNSYRMSDLYPPGFFYDLTSSITFDFTETVHLILKANAHKLSSGEIYYNGRMGITADFSP